MQRRAFKIGAALLAVLGSAEAQAEVINDHPVYIAIVSVGSLGGLATSIGAMVYAIQQRTFHSAWIVPTLLSAAICGSFAGSIIADMAKRGASGLGIAAVIGYIASSIWPTAWLARSALADVDLGERLYPKPAPETQAEIQSLGQGSDALIFNIGGLSF